MLVAVVAMSLDSTQQVSVGSDQLASEAVKSGQYECTFCSKRFTRPGNRARHEKIHSEEKEYNCERCDKAFRDSCDLKRHMRVHTGEKLYKCSPCDKNFSQPGHLQRHILKVHSNSRPHESPYSPVAHVSASQTSAKPPNHTPVHGRYACGR